MCPLEKHAEYLLDLSDPVANFATRYIMFFLFCNYPVYSTAAHGRHFLFLFERGGEIPSARSGLLTAQRWLHVAVASLHNATLTKAGRQPSKVKPSEGSLTTAVGASFMLHFNREESHPQAAVLFRFRRGH